MSISRFNSANNLLVTSEPLEAGVATVIWISEPISQGSTYRSLSCYITYHEIIPNTSIVFPYNFEIIAVVEQLQSDGEWQEIARQNTPIRQLDQGAERQIVVAIDSVAEEGIDQIIPGFDGVPARIKSLFRDEASNSLRIKLVVKDMMPDGPNPFVGVRFSVRGSRF